MSSDNYILIRKHNGKYVVSNESASSDEPDPVEKGTAYDTLDEAWNEATAMYSEYGVEIDFDVEHTVKDVSE